MGGHGHGSKEPPYTIPSPDIYKVENVKKLVEYQQRLAKKGLHDPWLRNVVWRFQDSGAVKIRRMAIGGLYYGVPMILLTMAAEYYFDIRYPHHSDSHGHH